MVTIRIALVLAIASAPAHTQTPVIKVETREVPVDVTVAGKKAAGDLTAKDFSVWEDGNPRKINSVTAASADPDPSLRHFVLYFDFSSMPLADQSYSEQSAAAFVDGLATPDRYMAVMSMTPAGPRVIQDFTVSKVALKLAASNAHITAGPRQTGPGDPLPDSLVAVCRSMAPAPGRKAMLLFTGGHVDFRGEIPDAYKDSIVACNRANVAIYAIAGNSMAAPDIRNIRPGTNIKYGPPGSEDTSAKFGQFLSAGTGGESLSLNGTLKDKLAAVAREQDDYYRIFYTPPPAKEGSCHTLRVAVAEHGLTVRSRNEYCTEKAADLVAGKIAGQSLEAHTAGAGSLDAAIQLPWYYTGTNRASVHLSLDFIPAGMKFEANQTGLHGDIDIVGTVLRPDGGTAARFADTKSIDLANQQAADAFTKSPCHYEQQFTVAAGTYTFQLALGAGPNAIAKTEVPLKIDPWNPDAFGMGAIALSTEVNAIAPSASTAPILEGQAPLTAGGKQFTPSATNQFHPSDPVSLYTEFYEPATVTTPPMMQYCIQDRKTGKVEGCSAAVSLANFIRPGNPVVPFATRLPAVAQLPPGAYRLEVKSGIAGSQEVVTRTVDFEVKQ